MADNDVVIRSGRELTVGAETFEIIDDSNGCDFVDLITEARHMNGVVYLSLGSSVGEFNGPPVLHLSNRIRMSLVTAQNLKAMLENTIQDALKPVDKSTAN